MTLPPDFNNWEHLQSLLMSLVNREVREEFSDQGDDDNLSTPRGSLRAACWLRDKDTATITLLKMFLFYNIVKQGNLDELFSLVLDIAQYRGVGPQRKNRPKVSLFFRNRSSDPIVWRVVSCRLMNETPETFTKAQATEIASSIKTAFGRGNGYDWSTGKTMFAYTEWDRGYQFQILGSLESEAKQLIRDVLGLRGHVPNWTYFQTNTNDAPLETYPNTPQTIQIMGETLKEPARRPEDKVYLQYATLTLPPRKPVVLYDRTGRRFNALVT